MSDLWKPVIGLEIHVQLNTRSKLFSPAPNRFGDEPNTNISVVCTGQPGALPVLNKEAVRKAVQFGLAVNSTINAVSRFDRKSYFYPDSPRNFQITQYEKPILTGGTLTIEGKTFHISRAHLEDDAGMLKHFNSFTGVDYNRAGAPLLEIVSEPCIHSAKEASAFAMAIRAIMVYLGASECNMQEGSLRIDANISVQPKDSPRLRPKIEVKNMNSFSFMEMSIENEIRRQIDLYTKNPHTKPEELVIPGTYRWDPESKMNVLLRMKQSADDYRYFPEPDLVPLVITQDYIDWVRHTLPELPQERFNRYVSDLGLSTHAASVLIADKQLCDYFENALKYCMNPRHLCNWISIEFTGRLKELGKTLPLSGILPLHVAKLVEMIDQNKITGRIAKSIADDMVNYPGLSPEKIVKKNPDYQPLSIEFDLESLVDQVIYENAQSVGDFKMGKEKAFDYLIGQVMKQTRGKASPQIAGELLRKKLDIP